jgi:predicted RNase H-like HicB family nuclease/DNA-binding XRE family transcriptional regulator
MNYHFLAHQDDDGVWAECLELPGCVTQSDSFDTLLPMCKEALNLYLEEPPESEIVFPLPDMSLDGDDTLLKVPVEPEIALAMLLRRNRQDRKLTQKEVARLLGMKNIYSYQRLERKSNPSLAIIKKIHTVFPDIQLGNLL